MEINELSSLIEDSLNKISTPKFYASIANRNNNLHRFNMVNKILIHSQYKDAFDVRSSDEWEIEGRELLKNQTPIYVIMPNVKTTYIDADTNNKINISEFTSDELLKAIELNIIKKREEIENVYTIPMFDIRQTFSKNKDTQYIAQKPILKSSNTIKLARDIIGCKIQKSDITYLSTGENTLYVSDEPYNSLTESIVDVIVSYYMKFNIEKIINSTVRLDYNEYDIDLLKLTIQYSLDSLLNINRDSDFDTVRSIEKNKLFHILNIVDSVIFDIILKMDYNIKQDIKSETDNINKLRKAEIILDIMESNNINKIMKGA